MHHFSRIFCLDFSTVLSTALNSLLLLLHASQQSLKIWLTKSAKKRDLCASISAHSLHSTNILKLGTVIIIVLQRNIYRADLKKYYKVLNLTEIEIKPGNLVP